MLIWDMFLMMALKIKKEVYVICINIAAIKFIPLNQMEDKNYGYLIHFIKGNNHA